jgi:hypothetical protein
LKYRILLSPFYSEEMEPWVIIEGHIANKLLAKLGNLVPDPILSEIMP